MGQVIPFAPKKKRDLTQQGVDPAHADEAQRLMDIASELDDVILRNLHQGDVDPRDLAGLISHRLGTLIRHLDEKERLWSVCEQVLRAQAALGPKSS